MRFNTHKSYQKTIQGKGAGERETKIENHPGRGGRENERMRFQHRKENHAEKGKEKRERQGKAHTHIGGISTHTI